jgi:hypothetical protein
MDSSRSQGYRYDPLDTTTGEIRLLTINTANYESETIDVSILENTLDRAGDYFALSYTWGDPKGPRREITLNGHPFSVGINLFKALRSIRTRLVLAQLSIQPKLWVDALCINQENIREKNVQVKRMQDIYARATVVWIYIGSGFENHETAINFMSALAKKYESMNPLSGLSETVCDEIARHIVHPGLKDAWKLLGDLLTRPWWTRAWTVQEVVLAKSAFFMCGETNVNFSDIMYVGEVLGTYLKKILKGTNETSVDRALAFEKHQGLESGILEVQLLALQHRIQISDTQLSSLDRPAFLEAASSLGIRARQPSELTWTEVSDTVIRENFHVPGHRFCGLLARFKDRECRDPHDKVYAFLGLARQHMEAAVIPLDYEMELPKLWRSVTRAHLECYQNLEVFELFANLHGPDGFSSWAHEITTEAATRGIPTRLEVPKLGIRLNASLGVPADYAFPPGEEEELILKGVAFDTVTKAGHAFDMTYSDEIEARRLNGEQNHEDLKSMVLAFEKSQKALEGWTELSGVERAFGMLQQHLTNGDSEPAGQELANIWNDAAVSTGRYPTGQRNLDAFVQTLMLDSAKHAEYGKVYQERRDTLVTHGRGDVLAEIFFSSLLLQSTFYVTEKGYFGFGPKDVKAGDRVCVPFGGKTPYLLRLEENHYLVVGWSFVHGFMNGEAIELVRRDELMVESFVLR